MWCDITFSVYICVTYSEFDCGQIKAANGCVCMVFNERMSVCTCAYLWCSVMNEHTGKLNLASCCSTVQKSVYVWHLIVSEFFFLRARVNVNANQKELIHFEFVKFVIREYHPGWSNDIRGYRTWIDNKFHSEIVATSSVWKVKFSFLNCRKTPLVGISDLRIKWQWKISALFPQRKLWTI